MRGVRGGLSVFDPTLTDNFFKSKPWIVQGFRASSTITDILGRYKKGDFQLRLAATQLDNVHKLLEYKSLKNSSGKRIAEALDDIGNLLLNLLEEQFDTSGESTGDKWEKNVDFWERDKFKRTGSNKPLVEYGITKRAFSYVRVGETKGVVGIPLNVINFKGQSVGKIAEMQESGYNINVTPKMKSKFKKRWGIKLKKKILVVPPRPIREPVVRKAEKYIAARMKNTSYEILFNRK